MHFQFLIEDYSGQICVEHVMEKLRGEGYQFTYDCKFFKGIGGLKVGGKAGQVKTDKLLNDLQIYLRGFDKSLKWIEAAIVVVLDNDRRDTQAFREQLNAIAKRAELTVDHVFCIAVEEMEAWLLGDRIALQRAYADARMSMMRDYVQDSICGTWEILANVVYKGGVVQLKKDCPTYREIGTYKAEWADRIGAFLELDRNTSPSFQRFVGELRSRLTAPAFA